MLLQIATFSIASRVTAGDYLVLDPYARPCHHPRSLALLNARRRPQCQRPKHLALNGVDPLLKNAEHDLASGLTLAGQLAIFADQQYRDALQKKAQADLDALNGAIDPETAAEAAIESLKKALDSRVDGVDAELAKKQAVLKKWAEAQEKQLDQSAEASKAALEKQKSTLESNYKEGSAELKHLADLLKQAREEEMKGLQHLLNEIKAINDFYKPHQTPSQHGNEHEHDYEDPATHHDDKPNHQEEHHGGDVPDQQADPDHQQGSHESQHQGHDQHDSPAPSQEHNPTESAPATTPVDLHPTHNQQNPADSHAAPSSPEAETHNQ